MWIPLPEGLADFLRMVGFDWPEADEERLWECGDAWGRFAQTLRNLAEDADRTVDQVLGNNTDDSISAFGERWKEFKSGDAGWLTAGVEGAELAQKAFYGCSVIVITLKIAVIAELIALAITWAAAIAAAVETFGASLAAAAARTAAVRVTVKLALKAALEAIKRIGGRIIKRAVERVSKAIKRIGRRRAGVRQKTVNNLRKDPNARKYQGTGRGRRKNKFPDTGGPPNGTLYRTDANGNVTYYAKYDSQGRIVKRVDFDQSSALHAGVPPPHTVEYTWHTGPNGRSSKTPGPTRPWDPNKDM